MNVQSAVCDVHHEVELDRVATIHGRNLIGETLTVAALFCPMPECSRFYSPLRGYFYAKEGELPDFGVPRTKLQCLHDSEPTYWFLMWNDGKLVWACPECGGTEEYRSSTQKLAAIN